MNIRIEPIFTIHTAAWHNPEHLMVYFRIGFNGWWFYVMRCARTERLWTYGFHRGVRGNK